MNVFKSFFQRKPPTYFISVKGGKIKVPETNEIPKVRYYIMLCTIFGLGGLSLFPLLIDPIIYENEYKARHKALQTELFQAGNLPGQLRKWEDPWKK